MEFKHNIIIDYVRRFMKYDFDCINIILEFVGYKYRNGKYMYQIDKQDIRYNILHNMPKIIKYIPEFKEKPIYQVKINKERGGVKIVFYITTSLYFGDVIWFMNFAYDYGYGYEGNILPLIHYKYNYKYNYKYK
jgi:hypothetical protein